MRSTAIRAVTVVQYKAARTTGQQSAPNEISDITSALPLLSSLATLWFRLAYIYTTVDIARLLVVLWIHRWMTKSGKRNVLSSKQGKFFLPYGPDIFNGEASEKA